MDEKKVKEAIEYLSGYIQSNINLMEKIEGIVWIGEEPCKTAIEALEKQLPKKVKMRTEYRDLNDELICCKGFCPSCGNVVDSYRNKSCNHCTQMLDWSEAH
ncbi:hypothetical protein [Mediterraneibacter gnavus]|uniref:hypothetical protein n=1 Tax=Mediterraneibacter gnavus TaxID=33038 RepID=UPI003568F9E4